MAEGTPTDKSGTTTASSSKTLMAANNARSWFFVQNLGAVDIWIGFGVTAVAGKPCMKIAPDGSYTSDSNMFGTKCAITVFCTAEQDYTALEG